jgi:hypothetical protein
VRNVSSRAERFCTEKERTDLGGREFFLERIHPNSANVGVLLLK